MSQLDKLRELGVKELSVRNNLATAVNPHPYNYDHDIYPSQEFSDMQIALKDLPPLPTSGIPDGPVGIEEVEPVEQYYHPTYRAWRIKSPNLITTYQTRQAIRYKQQYIELTSTNWDDPKDYSYIPTPPKVLHKQQEEVKPEGELDRFSKKLIEAEPQINNLLKRSTELLERVNSLPQPEQPEQTAEFKWTDDTVIDFVNAYVDLHNLGTKYKLENRNIIEDFKKKREIDKWKS